MTTNHVRLLAALALATLPVTALAWGNDCKYTAQRTGQAETTGIERVEIMARAGDLKVAPAAGATVAARGVACASSMELLDGTRLHVVREGKLLRVHVQVPEDMKGIGTFYASMDLEVDVPADLPVSITDSSGDMRLEQVRVERVLDSSGDVVGRGLRGGLEIEDSSGDIRLDDVAGAVRLSDSSGDIVIRGAQGVHITQDSSGDIDLARIAGDVTIDQDSSGDVIVANVDGNFTLRADGSGHVRVSAVKGTVDIP